MIKRHTLKAPRTAILRGVKKLCSNIGDFEAGIGPELRSVKISLHFGLI